MTDATLNGRRQSAAVSVIVPVYNTGEYLTRCLDSILTQTLREIEIVAIDDGSTDQSGRILERYAKEDPRVTVVRHGDNLGLHAARISGVLASSGRFLGYVDSDDWAASDMFERMYSSALNSNSEIVRTGAWLVRELDLRDACSNHQPATLSFSDMAFATGIDYLDADFYPSMCLHLHHRRLWNVALPHLPGGRLFGEDNLTAFVLAFFAGRVVSLSALGYFYAERNDSISTSLSFRNVARHIRDRAKIVALLRDFVAAAGGRAERAWQRVSSDNKGLILSYMRGLENRTDRIAAVTLFERCWGEPVPGNVKTELAVD